MHRWRVGVLRNQVGEDAVAELVDLRHVPFAEVVGERGQPLAISAFCPAGGLAYQLGTDEQFQRDVLAGAKARSEIPKPGGEVVDARLDTELMATKPGRGELTGPAVVTERCHRLAGPSPLAVSAVVNLYPQRVMPVREHIGF